MYCYVNWESKHGERKDYYNREENKEVCQLTRCIIDYKTHADLRDFFNVEKCVLALKKNDTN